MHFALKGPIHSCKTIVSLYSVYAYKAQHTTTMSLHINDCCSLLRCKKDAISCERFLLTSAGTHGMLFVAFLSLMSDGHSWHICQALRFKYASR